jgi:hypothetical protein
VTDVARAHVKGVRNKEGWIRIWIETGLKWKQNEIT